MKQKILLLGLALLLIFSCQKKQKKYFYDSGELHYEEYFGAKDSLIYLKEYYKNGRLKQHGHISPSNAYTGFGKNIIVTDN